MTPWEYLVQEGTLTIISFIAGTVFGFFGLAKKQSSPNTHPTTFDSENI